MSFPKKGNLFPRAPNDDLAAGYKVHSKVFAARVASALNEELGKTTAHVKIVAAWTGANERTVKNWFAGHYGPSGDHLVTLIRHCDAVLMAVLSMADRDQLLVGAKLEDIERRLAELLETLRRR
ncbi:hypothetical protein HAP48_0017075 [Bradyrhizobium septentrionale]|uniref:XRE family transcriptional regulator n=1 Tax=Bradyrhizobium septentrionale TaxID=1404411 RepID=A0A973VTX2_9BRAD|nr:hypothetical protein [Bradyrhizobium septentrionale]UGY19008.1 hypothetical protein HAP48_0017075 [Bradyrhizobium septentrionale]UGY27737.1 hypothetical protein HU675_0013790 [Bradyrhizobium septentrionale]